MTEQDKTSTEFWKHKRLSQMNHDEWESLCDGCARCCLHKLEDAEDGQIYYTKAACELLEISTCRCTDYNNRKLRIPDCMQLSVKHAEYFNWLPATCAYRLLAEGEALPDWHPLVTGDPLSVFKAGISVGDFARPIVEFEDITEAVISLTSEGVVEPDET